MEIAITQEQATKYPKEYTEALTELRNSRSKYKNTPPQELVFKISWCVMGQAIIGVNNLLQAVQKTLGQIRVEPPTLEEYIDQFKNRSKVRLYVKGQRSNAHYTSGFFRELPAELKEHLAKTYEITTKQQALTKEQLEERFEDLIDELSGMGGFQSTNLY